MANILQSLLVKPTNQGTNKQKTAVVVEKHDDESDDDSSFGSSSPRCVSKHDLDLSNNNDRSSFLVIKEEDMNNNVMTMPLYLTSGESMLHQMTALGKFNHCTNSQCANLLINRNEVHSLKELSSPPSEIKLSDSGLGMVVYLSKQLRKRKHHQACFLDPTILIAISITGNAYNDESTKKGLHFGGRWYPIKGPHGTIIEYTHYSDSSLGLTARKFRYANLVHQQQQDDDDISKEYHQSVKNECEEKEDDDETAAQCMKKLRAILRTLPVEERLSIMNAVSDDLKKEVEEGVDSEPSPPQQQQQQQTDESEEEGCILKPISSSSLLNTIPSLDHIESTLQHQHQVNKLNMKEKVDFEEVGLINEEITSNNDNMLKKHHHHHPVYLSNAQGSVPILSPDEAFDDMLLSNILFGQQDDTVYPMIDYDEVDQDFFKAHNTKNKLQETEV